jgi:hypothetical protein
MVGLDAPEGRAPVDCVRVDWFAGCKSPLQKFLLPCAVCGWTCGNRSEYTPSDSATLPLTREIANPAHPDRADRRRRRRRIHPPCLRVSGSHRRTVHPT